MTDNHFLTYSSFLLISVVMVMKTFFICSESCFIVQYSFSICFYYYWRILRCSISCSLHFFIIYCLQHGFSHVFGFCYIISIIFFHIRSKELYILAKSCLVCQKSYFWRSYLLFPSRFNFSLNSNDISALCNLFSFSSSRSFLFFNFFFSSSRNSSFDFTFDRSLYKKVISFCLLNPNKST